MNAEAFGQKLVLGVDRGRRGGGRQYQSERGTSSQACHDYFRIWRFLDLTTSQKIHGQGADWPEGPKQNFRPTLMS